VHVNDIVLGHVEHGSCIRIDATGHGVFHALDKIDLVNAKFDGDSPILTSSSGFTALTLLSRSISNQRSCPASVPCSRRCSTGSASNRPFSECGHIRQGDWFRPRLLDGFTSMGRGADLAARREFGSLFIGYSARCGLCHSSFASHSCNNY
jgi:hypothetical protein